MLSGTDDGARDDNEMFAMLDMSYRTGTRRICFTPHFNTVLWRGNCRAGEEAFEKIRAYSAQRYPDMSLCLGNELFYSESGIEYLNSGECRTLNFGRYVLVDFHFGALFYEIKKALLDLLNSGYIPVFAHAERYPCIAPPFDTLREFRDFGIVIQLSASSVLGEGGRLLRKKTLKMLKHGLADVIASDSHNTSTRSPRLDTAASVVKKRFGVEYAELLFLKNPDKILGPDKK